MGTGVVGRTLAAKLDDLGHEVVIGTRDPARGTEVLLPLWLRLMGAPRARRFQPPHRHA